MTKQHSRIVVDTSPWIALSLCNQTQILKEIYSEVYIPFGVKTEILVGGKAGVGIKELKESRWLKIEKVKDREKIEMLYELEQGEAEVIVLAKEKNIQVVMFDERVARLQAKILGLKVIGTLGLLLKAKKIGILSQIKPSIQKIISGGYWIDKALVEGIFAKAGEGE